MGESRTGQTPSNVRFDRMRVCGDGVAVAKLECVSTERNPADVRVPTIFNRPCIVCLVNECRIQGHEATLLSL